MSESPKEDFPALVKLSGKCSLGQRWLQLHLRSWARLLSQAYFQIPDSWFSSAESLSRVRLCNPMKHSMPGPPVHHQLPEFTQTHAHRVGYAIQPFHPLLSPSPPAPNPSQHQGLFQWVNSAWRGQTQYAEFQLQHQSFQWTPRTDLL